ncbi:FHA domain-containing protein [Pseudomonas synxantha]|uniref:Type III secretion protein n=1 Tax=Pseudomonas synxantha TaxID=47883 RepID=A0AAX3I0Y0_9PSED|nr:FHA domain-containing protein [Pseudomonas synxantha]AZE64935.1 type III secretion protein HrpQ [Pseudomonas synxantha]KRP49917.1 type III secretion protein [Pseudomonas synxantha]MBI6563880.1 type III secretion protein [Pseudomonas synxantha]MBI6581116.1 type III secretion protein [Pseudomonas synxantha]MBI6642302.1 type III secretion protein [Pseudomonas synxantha]
MFELRVLDGLHQGAALPLFGEQWSLGAHGDADLLLDDPGIAEHHARLLLADGRWSVQAEAGLLKNSDGQMLAQISDLALNTAFVIGSVSLCVSPADQPWLQASAPKQDRQVVQPEPQTSLPLTLSSISSTQQKGLVSLLLLCAVIIMAVGIIFSGEREAQASLMPAVIQKPGLDSPSEVRQQLIKMLTERELLQRVSLQIVNDQIALNGVVSQEEVELIARMLDRFAEQFDTGVPVISRVRVRDGRLPFRILQIVGGPNGHVVLEEGTRLFVGDEVDGLRLVLIDNSKVVFDGEQRYEVGW